MRVALSEDEMYPVYNLHDDISDGIEVQIGVDLYVRVRRIQSEWDAIQKELYAMYWAAREKMLQR